MSRGLPFYDVVQATARSRFCFKPNALSAPCLTTTVSRPDL